ncbi:putative oxidoreductase [Helianthus anomalus]
MIHDWAFTDSHYILFGNRIKLDILGNILLLLLFFYKLDFNNPNYNSFIDNFTPSKNTGSMTAVCGFTPMITALSVNPSKSTSPIYLLPRFPEHEERRDWKVPIEAPSQMWVLHVGNAFQETDHNGNTQIRIQASGCSYKWFNFQKMFGTFL